MTKTSSKPSPVKNISVCGISMKPQKNQKPLVRLDQSSKDSSHQERKQQIFQQNKNINTSWHDSNQCMKSKCKNLNKTCLVNSNDILNTVENENNSKMLNYVLTHVDINEKTMDGCLNQIPVTTSISHAQIETNDQNFDMSKIEVVQVLLSGNQLEDINSLNESNILDTDLTDIAMTYKNENDLPLDLSTNQNNVRESIKVNTSKMHFNVTMSDITHHVNINQTNINEAERNDDINSNLSFVINEEQITTADGSIDVEDKNSIKLLTKSSKLVNKLVFGSTIVNTDDAMVTEDSPDEGIEIDRELVIDEELSNNENAFAEEKDHREQKINVMNIPHVSSNVSYSQNISDSTSLNSDSQSILVYAKKSTITDENILNNSKEDIELEHIGTSVSKAYYAKDIAFKKSVEGRNQRKLINEISKKKLVIDVNKKPTEVSKRELNRIHCQAYRLKQKRKEKELIMERETLKQRNLELKNTHERMKEELDKLKLIVSKILEKKNA